MIVENGLKKFTNTNYEKFNDLFIDKSYYDVLFLGSSRTHNNIDVRIVDSIVGVSSYNAGIPGAGGYEMLTILKGYLYAHPKPKMIILNVDMGVLNINKTFFNPTFYFDSFDNEEIYFAFKEKEFPVWLYRYLPFTRMLEFNDNMRNDCLSGIMGKSQDYKLYKGYVPMKEQYGKIDSVYNITGKIEDANENYKYIDSICNIANRNSIELIFIVSPSYNNHYKKESKNYQNVINNVKNNFCLKNSVPLLFFDQIPLNYSTQYFYDNIHLNIKGTELFSRSLAEEIKILLLKKDDYSKLK